jgi:hypothetical protein
MLSTETLYIPNTAEQRNAVAWAPARLANPLGLGMEPQRPDAGRIVAATGPIRARVVRLRDAPTSLPVPAERGRRAARNLSGRALAVLLVAEISIVLIYDLTMVSHPRQRSDDVRLVQPGAAAHSVRRLAAGDGDRRLRRLRGHRGALRVFFMVAACGGSQASSLCVDQKAGLVDTPMSAGP